VNKDCEMKVRRLAGIVVLLGIGIGNFVSTYGYLLSVFAGFNLIQSSFTGICPPEKLIPVCRKESSRD
jgi:hypothetical protein